MRRRDMIAGAGAALLPPATAFSEVDGLPAALPAGTREIARYVNLPGKTRLLRLTDRPPNYATPVDTFTDMVTPNDRFFVRYHMDGVPPEADLTDWSLKVGGDAAGRDVALTMNDLLDLPQMDLMAVCQCAGNRRGLVTPHVPGVQWGDGAMGAARWQGPRLSDVLKAARIKNEATEIWLGGADTAPMPHMPLFRKSIRIEKAMDGDTIIAVAMNNEPLPLLNGFPARLVVPGWTGTYWMKHLNSIEASTTPLANFWMKTAYRVPAGMFPVKLPFTSQATAANVPITEMVVNSLIADPEEGSKVERSGFTIQGVAWDRGTGIKRVEISLDGGLTWQDALLNAPLGRYAFRRFSLETGFLKRGAVKILSRATNDDNERQPDTLTFNAGGYHNNVPRAITVTVI